MPRREAAQRDADVARQRAADKVKLDLACIELQALIPNLSDWALEHDRIVDPLAPVQHRKPTGHSMGSPVNEEVQKAWRGLTFFTNTILDTIEHRFEEIPFEEVLDEGPGATIRALLDWWRKMHKYGYHDLADTTLAELLRQLDACREALGLTTRDQPLGSKDRPINCPDPLGQHHGAPAPLYQLGREGQLDDTILRTPVVNGVVPAGVVQLWEAEHSTWVVPTGAISWRSFDTVRCPGCRTEWSGANELLILARQLGQS